MRKTSKEKYILIYYKNKKIVLNTVTAVLIWLDCMNSTVRIMQLIVLQLCYDSTMVYLSKYEKPISAIISNFEVKFILIPKTFNLVVVKFGTT